MVALEEWGNVYSKDQSLTIFLSSWRGGGGLARGPMLFRFENMWIKE